MNKRLDDGATRLQGAGRMIRRELTASLSERGVRSESVFVHGAEKL